MKNHLATASALLFIACSADSGGPPSGRTGGSAGTPGAPATGGATGAAGRMGGAGTGGSAGSAGTAGTAGTAGSAGSAGRTGDAGITAAGGMTVDAAMMDPTRDASATGGAAGAGGRGGGAGAGGTGGAAPDAAAPAIACPTMNEERFSFFLISNKALIREGGADASGMFSKLGGNLGGIKGADALCQRAAEFVSPCQRNKTWRAFLSTTTEDAIDRIGTGPWYDRRGRLWASSLTAVLQDRPADADPAIKNDPPNEEGVPNHNPDGTGDVDNHQILTGTGTNGRLYRQSTTPGEGGGSTQCGRDVGAAGAAAWSPERATCWNWTRSTPEGCPRVGRSWCTRPTCTPPGSGSGTNWMSVWNEGGCAPGGTLVQEGGLDGTRRVGSAGGYGGFYCFAVMPSR